MATKVPKTTQHIELRNCSNGKYNKRVEFSISAHAHSGIAPAETVWIHLSTGVLSGGFHTTPQDARRLGQALIDASNVVFE